MSGPNNLQMEIANKINISPLKALSILVVDDDGRLITLMRDILHIFGFKHIYVAHSGREAINSLRTKEIHMVITDWEMKNMSGLELIHFLRNDPSSPAPYIPVIMLTGRADAQDVERARDTGATEFLAKPFTVEGLRERIISVIEKPRAFVIAQNYKGPERRRRKKATPDGIERRTSD